MSRKQAECLLAAVIFARSTSLLFAKIGLNSFTPLNLLAVRFCLAFAVLAVIFWKKLRAATKTDLWHGAVLFAAVASLLLESPHLPGTARGDAAVEQCGYGTCGRESTVCDGGYF